MTSTVVYFTDSVGFGGAERALLTLMGELDRRRWRPVLVYHDAPGIAPLLDEARRLDVTLWAAPRMQGMRGLMCLPHFVRKLRAVRPAVFHAHLCWPLACKYGLVGAALARVAVVVATEHLFIDVPWRRSILLERVASLGVDRYIAVSHDLARRLRQTFGFPARKVQVIHNAIAPQLFDRPAVSALRASLTGGAARPIILSAARLDPQKGHRYLLEAAVQAPDALFVLAGDGPERAALEAQARGLGLAERVRFLGFRQDVPDLLASCDLFVLPSLFEGLPLAVLEAMAAGKPVVASAVGGTDEVIIHGQTGLLAPPADSTALAAAINTLLADPALARRLAVAGSVRVRQEFSVETMVRRVTQLYDDLLGQRVANGWRSPAS